MKSVRKAAVLGSGSWGTALATVVAQHAETVSLWGRDEALCRDIRERHRNTRYLPGIELDPKIRATTELRECVEGAEVVIVGLPTKALAAVLE
ncbi:MAG: NAD(P)-binding domain-containing protein, partial [Elusimicrobiota bacterium]